VEEGRADWVSLLDPSLTPERQRGALTRHADRLHSDPLPATFWLALNTRVPPLDDVRVRRALNYAIDRAAMVEGTGSLTQETCQMLPPSFPGYRPYCPYTREPNPAGTWTAPDLARARALVAASATAGTRVEIATYTSAVTVPIARYVASALRELGYRSSIRFFPVFGDHLAYAADSRNRAQIAILAWQADTLTASSFLRPLFACASFVPKSRANTNLSRYCDPALEAKMNEAASLQAADPKRANELWSEVDQALVDRAVAVPWGSSRNRVLVSKRVGNYQSHPLLGTLLEQLWVR
jgi:peptide/nickel transport system substrate-binding protein